MGQNVIFILGMNLFDILFVGMIDDVKFYDIVLIVGEVKNLDVILLSILELLVFV